jgi:hypothetical protein
MAWNKYTFMHDAINETGFSLPLLSSLSLTDWRGTDWQVGVDWCSVVSFPVMNGMHVTKINTVLLLFCSRRLAWTNALHARTSGHPEARVRDDVTYAPIVRTDRQSDRRALLARTASDDLFSVDVKFDWISTKVNQTRVVLLHIKYMDCGYRNIRSHDVSFNHLFSISSSRGFLFNALYCLKINETCSIYIHHNVR